MKLFISAVLGIALVTALPEDNTPKHNVFFPANSSELSGSPARVVESVYEQMVRGESIRFGITGPISHVHGVDSKNRITLERANSIISLLQQIGTDKDSIEIIDVTNPYQVKLFDPAKKELFKIEVFLCKSAGWVEPVFTSIDEFLPIPVQTFQIDPRRDTSLVGEQGTIINIPGNTLCLRNGSVPSNMTVELKEVYGGGTIVNADLHTNSGGKMLETGGTIHLDAHTNGSRAKVAYGEQIDLEFPTEEGEEMAEGMELFKGRVDRAGNFDWQPRRRNRNKIERSRYFVGDKQVTKAVYDSTKAAWEAEKELTDNILQEAENSEALDKYLMSTDELGWINCDRFLNEDRPLTDVIVSVDSVMRPSVKLVFDNIKSVMPGYYDPHSNTVKFINIPIDESVRIVGYSIMNGTPYMANQQVRVSKNMKTVLTLSETTKSDMKAELASLN